MRLVTAAELQFLLVDKLRAVQANKLNRLLVGRTLGSSVPGSARLMPDDRLA